MFNNKKLENEIKLLSNRVMALERNIIDKKENEVEECFDCHSPTTKNKERKINFSHPFAACEKYLCYSCKEKFPIDTVDFFSDIDCYSNNELIGSFKADKDKPLFPQIKKHLVQKEKKIWKIE